MAGELVLAHGWGMADGVWDPLRDQLDPALRCHGLCLPGHGGAPFDPGWRDLAAWADALLAQAPARALWVGWSLGGLVALAAALGPRGPTRIAGLVLIGTTPRFVQAPDWSAGMPAAIFAGFREALSRDPTATLERFTGLLVRGSSDPRGLLRRLRGLLAGAAPSDAGALAAGLDLLGDTDLRGVLATLKVPTRWVFGAADALVPAGAADAVRALLPDAPVHCLAGAGHVPMLSHTEPLAALVRDSLADFR